MSNTVSVNVAESPRRQLRRHGPIGAMLFKLAAPKVAATLMLTTSTFADAWFVGIAVGLAVFGIGQAPCLWSATWRPGFR